MSRTLFSLAGFQVITIGRFWVIAEDYLRNACYRQLRLQKIRMGVKIQIMRQSMRLRKHVLVGIGSRR